MTSLQHTPPPPVTDTSEAASRATAWGLTSVLMLLYLINYGDKVLLGIVAQPLKDELGLSASQIGLAGSVFFFAMTAGGFLAGPLSKRAPLKWVLAALAIGWALCLLPMIVAASFAMLVASRLVLGLFEGPSSALIHTATYSWHPVEKRALPGALITSAAALSKIILAPLLTYLVVAHGWRSAFVAMCAASLLWGAIWLTTWRPGPYGAPSRPRAGVGPDGSRPSSMSWRTLRTPTFLGGLAAAFSFYTLVSVILTWLPSYFEVGLGYSRLKAGSMFAIPSLVALVALFATSYLGDRMMTKGISSRIHRGIIPGAGLLICGLCMVCLPWIGAAGLVVAVVSVGYGLGTVVFPLLNAAVSEICPKEQLAGTLGVFLALMSSGGIVGPYLAGWIVDHTTSAAAGYALTFQVLGAVAALGAIAALLTVNPPRDARRVLAGRTGA
ncbi:MFS transporter [Streptomyces sp. BH104]|uniref:MFS transporter n=1 Tax=Streptomyces sp. BH104 TaxID=3410407 RepID=UPI003BB49F6E